MMLPNGWKKVKIKDIESVGIQNGFSPLCVDYKTKRKSLSLGSLTGFSLDVSQQKNISEDAVMPIHSLLKRNDILVSRSNTKDKVGRAAVVLDDLREIYYPDLMMRFQVNEKIADSQFVALCLQSPSGRGYFESHAAGTSTSMVKINKGVLENFSMLLPPIEEQKKIAATLSVWDSAIEKMEKLIEAKENELNIVLRQNLLEKGIALKWKEIPLTEILKSVTPPSKIHQDSYLNSGKYPIVDQSKDLIAGWTNDESSVQKINRPLIIFGDHTCALKIMHMPFAQGADGIKILSAKDGYDPTYIYYAIKANPVIPEGYKRHFSALMLKSILCPSLEEQKKYAVYFKSLDEEISLLKQQLENYKKQKQGLMQKLLTGQWRVK